MKRRQFKISFIMEKETRKCPYCGEEILAVAKKCKYCGEWLTEEKAEDTPKQMIPCPICSEMIEEGTEICPHCHEKLTKPGKLTPAITKTIKTEKEDDGTRSFFDYYLWDPFFRHYFDFKGRLNRKHYWLSIMVWLGVCLALIVMLPPIGAFIFMVFFVASIIPLYATAARRMRDGDSIPGIFGWISLFFPTVLWWLVKPTEYRAEGMEDAEPDIPQAVKFKKVDKIICCVYALLFVIGIAVFYIVEKKSSTETEQIEVIADTDSENAENKDIQENVKKAYIDYLSILDEMDEDQVYGHYFLYDITGDGIPEIWVESGTCEADHAISVYTYKDKLTILDAGEEGNASHSGFFRGEDYILQVSGHMGYQAWSKITYHNGKLKREVIFEEDLNESGKDDYRELSEPAVESYSFDETEPIMSMFDNL